MADKRAPVTQRARGTGGTDWPNPFAGRGEKGQGPQKHPASVPLTESGWRAGVPRRPPPGPRSDKGSGRPRGTGRRGRLANLSRCTSDSRRTRDTDYRPSTRTGRNHTAAPAASDWQRPASQRPASQRRSAPRRKHGAPTRWTSDHAINVPQSRNKLSYKATKTRTQHATQEKR